MGVYKTQAARLRERLKKSGVQVPMALSLEAIAAVHEKPNWDSLAPLDAGAPELPKVALGAVAPFQYAGIHSRWQPAPPSGPALKGWITTVVGAAGMGKTMLACAVARAQAEEHGRPVLYVDVYRYRYQSDVDGAGQPAVLRAIDDWVSERRPRPGVIVVDALEGVAVEAREELLVKLIEAASAGHDCLLLTQRSRDLVGVLTSDACVAATGRCEPKFRTMELRLGSSLG